MSLETIVSPVIVAPYPSHLVTIVAHWIGSLLLSDLSLMSTLCKRKHFLQNCFPHADFKEEGLSQANCMSLLYGLSLDPGSRDIC